MSPTETAIVIGGGIAGPVTATALAKAGLEATVYEAYPAASDGVGGALALAPNGLAALAVIDAADALRAMAVPAGAAHGHVDRRPETPPAAVDPGPATVADGRAR